MKSSRFDTKLIHGAYDRAGHYGSLTPPLYQTSTYSFDSAEAGERRFAGEEAGYVYSRLGNPTVHTLEARMAELEGGEAAVAFSSGMAAVSAVLVTEGVYGCTYGFFSMLEERFGVEVDFLAMEDEEALSQALRPETKVIYVETPINPTMKLVDVEMVTRFAREHGLQVVVDNTFATPYLQRPLAQGADVVVHSATKYLGGHGDLIAGVAVGRENFMEQVRMETHKDIGGILAPFDAWLLLRGLKTLSLRMDRHCENAAYVFERLKDHPKVRSIRFPGDPASDTFRLAERQMSQFGGLISFELHGGKKEAQAFLNRLKLAQIAVSLGDPETLCQHPYTMTHSVVPVDKRREMGISDALLRVSVGLEHPEDIWQDLKQALDG
ncbi:aminotransferase class I/II-fold pyridoxal phosphate-dependent enzyme [Salsuginibacillus kocurii]|uniref:aminotransferase class I/II-fold pyridoxal phosphate-dependent enzyme n=1 Tax=Salsuginibacillus kocurii TaxID=427078 RepID=UPI00036FE604|nr:aminotransferase class I/II-fold pyridoxal phosphate-dependent enzyme [Salsuginibacillus kocurii]